MCAGTCLIGTAPDFVNDRVKQVSGCGLSLGYRHTRLWQQSHNYDCNISISSDGGVHAFFTCPVYCNLDRSTPKTDFTMPTNRDAILSLAASEGRSSGTRLLALAALAESLGMSGEAADLVGRAFDVFDISHGRLREVALQTEDL
jgi:hypothetical protein